MYRPTVFTLKRIIARTAYDTAKLFGANDGISAMCYHSVSSSSSPYALSITTCIKQLNKIRAYATFLQADDIMQVLLKKKEISASAVLLTIDDGYKDVLSLLPYTEKYDIKPLLFVLSHPQKANRKDLGNSDPLLSWSDIKLLQKHGWTIGCHSATHTDFAGLTEQELFFEVNESKRTLEKKLGVPVEYFAYPKGVYNDQIVNQVKKAGYKAAFGIDPGCITSKSSRYLLPRTIIKQTHAVSEFPAIYSPSTYALRSLLENIPLRRFISI